MSHDDNYAPTAYFVRVLFRNNGMTLDTGEDQAKQKAIKQAIEPICAELLRSFGAEVPVDGHFEILLGATMNERERREDMLQDARNMLIEVSDKAPVAMREELLALIDEIEKELAL